MKSKTKQIENYLIKVGRITSLQAFTMFGLTRLASVIFRLRKSGWVISTTIIHEGEVNYARYKLISRPESPRPSPTPSTSPFSTYVTDL